MFSALEKLWVAPAGSPVVGLQFINRALTYADLSTNRISKGALLEPFAERLLLLSLAAINFTTIVDFIIIMPLGPQYMRVFSISPAQFGVIVSSYAISAGISGIAAGFFLDRFDRKRALLTLYGGFSLGTLFCALAQTYHLLVAARALAGAFGGVTGALILAIVGDVIPEHRRGAAMGLVMSAFSIANICGVPLGLILASSGKNRPRPGCLPFCRAARIKRPFFLWAC